MRTQAPTLNQWLTVQRRDTTPDARGQESQAWIKVWEGWGAAEPLSGRELFAAGQHDAAADVRFVVRYREDLTHAMRVLWRGVPHEITARPIDVEARKEYLHLLCTSGIRDGR